MSAIVVNLFAGPGAGKSTLAAHIFALLKHEGVNCELVREWIKDPVWEGRVLPDQFYIFAKQQRALRNVVDKVEVVVTDSPLLLSNIYSDPSEVTFRKLVKETFDKYDNFNLFLERIKKYNPAGRFQTEDQAKDIDAQVYKMLLDNEVFFRSVPGVQGSAYLITSQILTELYDD